MRFNATSAREWSIASTLVMLVAATPPFAQTTAGQTGESTARDEAARESEADDIDDNTIVVVGTTGGGTRRQDAAFAVSTLSNDAIDRIAPASTADLLKAVPGVSAESSGGQNGANIFVRGFPSGGDAEFVTIQSSGVPIFPPPTLSFLENTQLIRIDETIARVEAVRGGTGALFGSGQPGLTVNFVQREGGGSFAGLAKISVTDFGEVRGDGWVSGPVGPDTSFMIGGFYAESNGIRDPQFTAERGGQVTANVRHDFERGSVLAYARYLSDRGQWLLPIPVISDDGDISQFGNIDLGSGVLAGRDTRVTTANDGRTVDLADGRGAEVINLGLNFEFEPSDGITIRNRTSFLDGNADTVGLVPAGAPSTAASFVGQYNLTGQPPAMVGTLSFVDGGGTLGPSQQVVQSGVWEVRKDIKSIVNDASVSLETGGNTATLGFYATNYNSNDRWSLGNGLLLTAENNARRLNLTLADGRQATRDGFVTGSFFNVNAEYEGADYALYFVDEFQITPELRIDGGVRHQWHEVDGVLENNDFGLDTDDNPDTLFNNSTAVLNGTFSTIRFRGSEWSFTGGVNYDFTPDVGVFARFSRGNSFPFFDNLRDGIEIAPRVDSYEGGVKVTTPVVRLYATAFHNEFDGLATTQIINGTPLSQIGGAEATGVEAEGSVGPFSGFNLDFSATYLDATYDDFFTGGGTIDNTGNQVQRQPDWQFRITPYYEVEFGSATANVFATVAYIGDRFSDVENLQVLPSFTTLDAGISLRLDPEIIFMVTGSNLIDEAGLTEGNPRIIGGQGSGAILARPILGRSFRFSVSYGF